MGPRWLIYRILSYPILSKFNKELKRGRRHLGLFVVFRNVLLMVKRVNRRWMTLWMIDFKLSWVLPTENRRYLITLNILTTVNVIASHWVQPHACIMPSACNIRLGFLVCFLVCFFSLPLTMFLGWWQVVSSWCHWFPAGWERGICAVVGCRLFHVIKEYRK